MNVDIDQFIRDQKSKIAEERSYLSKHPKKEINLNPIENFIPSSKQDIKNDGFVLRMREGENMKNKYKQELRNDFSTSKQFNTYIQPYSSRKERPHSDTSDDEGLLYGIKYTNSASKRKEKIRNDEYNEFKSQEEAKFRNRFSDKKGISGNNKVSFIKSNPITNPTSNQSNFVTSESPKFSHPNKEYVSSESNQPKSFGSKIDDLERKVEDLRNFRIQNPYIFDPSDRQEEPPSIRYSKTDLGRNHLRYLEETEQRLKEIEDRYDSRKNAFKNGGLSPKKLRPILDNEEMFGAGRIGERIERKDVAENDSKSIVPTGRRDEEEMKRRRQEEYRRELQDQMREKVGKRRQPIETYDNGSFFDKFGKKDPPTKKVIEETFIPKLEKENDYFFYALHNPLDQFLQPERSTTEKSGLFVLDLEVQNRQDSGNIFGGTRGSDQSNKGNYREELKRQIEESKMRKQIEKQKLEDYERRKNEEIAMYEPFGRGGGGAPLRNDKGETISDLKRIMVDPDIVKRDPPAMKSMHLIDTVSNEPPNSQRGFARGGNGIFGKALTDEDKVKAERYKEELQIQIEKNKKQKAVEKENERLKEEHERVKFERDQKKIQLELENERKSQQEKELERQRQMEESRAAALKEKEKSKKSRIIEEETEEREEKKKEKKERVFSAAMVIQPERRGSSRHSLHEQSPIEMEATRRAQLPREDSRVMSQLYRLKEQLESEKVRVEQALVRQRDEVEVRDPRLGNKDVFQAVIEHRRPHTFRRRTDAPATGEKLDEHLRRQERLLARMGAPDFSRLELTMPDEVGPRPDSRMSNQLESESAFLRFDQSHEWRDRPSVTSYTPRTPVTPGNRHDDRDDGGSVASLNIDELTRKNERRLRKLQRLQDENDNDSGEDLLNRVVASEDGRRFPL